MNVTSPPSSTAEPPAAFDTEATTSVSPSRSTKVPVSMMEGIVSGVSSTVSKGSSTGASGRSFTSVTSMRIVIGSDAAAPSLTRMETSRGSADGRSDRERNVSPATAASKASAAAGPVSVT